MFDRIVKGIGANLIGQIVNFANRILLVPLFLHTWGVEKYGEWLALTSVAAYLSLTDFGAQLYIVNRLTQLYAQQNWDEYRKVLHTGLALFMVVPAVFMVLFDLVAPWISSSTLGIRETPHADVVWILFILSLQFAMSFPQGLLLGVYRSIGRYPTSAMLGNAIQLLQLALIAASLWRGKGMIWLALVQMIPLLAVTAWTVRDLRRLLPECNIGSWKEAGLTMALSFAKPSMHFLSIQVSMALQLQGTLLIVSSLLGSVQVVLFSTTRTVSNLARQFLGAVSHSVWPEMTRLDAENNKQRLFELFSMTMRVTLLMAAVCVIGAHYLGKEAFHFWLGEKINYRVEVMDLFMLYLFESLFWTSCSHVLMATNNHFFLSKLSLAGSILSIILSFALGKISGLYGVLFGMTLGDLLLPAWMVPLLLYRYDSRYSLAFYLRELLPVCFGILVAICAPVAAIPMIFLGALYAFNGYRKTACIWMNKPVS